MSPEEYSRFDLVGLCEGLARGDFSKAEINACAADRIAEFDGQFGAIAEIYDDRLEVKATDNNSHFQSIPMLMKDAGSAEEGRLQAFGSKLGEGHIVGEEDDLVRNLKDAGFNIIGRTTSPEFTIAATTESALYGPTRNPWNTALSSGGSSGGAAVAVAAGYVPVAHGTDTGGSIRIPAACCGVVGFKPTRGWDRPIQVDEQTIFGGLNHEFLITKTVRDSNLVFQRLSGSGKNQNSASKATTYQTIKEQSCTFKVGFVSTLSNQDIAPDFTAAVDQCARKLETIGFNVVESWPDFDEERWIEADKTVWSKSIQQLAMRLAGQTRRELNSEFLEPVTLEAIEFGRSISADDWFVAMDAFQVTRKSVNRFFDEVDFLLSPTIAEAPPPIGTLGTDQDVGFDAFLERTGKFAPFTPIFNVSGNPAISIPAGLTQDGMPIGLQLVGRYGSDLQVLAFARLIEDIMAPPIPFKTVPVNKNENRRLSI